jgi:uncharacterized RDD family membrane protein YckC
LVVTLLYTVPIVGFIVYKLLGILGHGVVVYTLLLLAGARSRERRAEHAGAVPAAAAASTAPLAASSAEGNEAATPTGSADPVEPTIATTLPRAGFWIRMGALAIDAVLVGLLFAFLPRHAHSLWLVLFAAYGVVMWKLRSTTVGGIICHLQVVRTDGRPIDWGTAVVRGLGCFLSLFAVGLGFIWIAIDEQHQSWHDKIAGTVVVRTARGLPLV